MTPEWQGGQMVELALEGWTAAQREGLAFLIDDAEIKAHWGPNSVSVSDESRDQVQRFITFLASGYEGQGPAAATPPANPGWDLDSPPLLFTDDLGISDVATPGLRLGGALVDGLVNCFVITVSFLAITRPQEIAWVVLFVVAGYDILMVGLLGRTLGNMAVRTRVVKIADGGVPGLRAAGIRWLVPQLGWMAIVTLPWLRGVSLVWSLIVYLPILSGPSYRGLHDRASGVMVLDDRLTGPHRAPSTELRSGRPSV